MEGRLLNVANDAKNVMAAQDINCPICGQHQFSPFDKLYTKAYGACVDCTPVDEYELKGENILAILEGS
jgi:hypothetical protein